MPREVFTWFPDVGATEQSRPDVLVTKFGDGYETRLGNGVNPTRAIWAVKFTRVNAEINAILAFLEARSAIDTFTWTTPRNVVGVYICRNWQQSRMQGGVMTVTADFERVYEP